MELFFQFAFLAIMTIGILGLPLYYILLARRKRMAQEFEEAKDSPETDSQQEN